MMRLVLNHITRMTAPRICVAGIDEATGYHVRPTTRNTDPITRALLAECGGPFEIGALVDLGQVKPLPAPPETEDHRFATDAARLVRLVEAAEYSTLLSAASRSDLRSIFGPELEQRRRGFAVERGHGSVSLGVLVDLSTPRIGVNRFEKLRLRFETNGTSADLSVTDVRLFEEDQRTVRAGIVSDLQRRMDRGIEVALMVGLTRAFRAEGDDRERHWLQANGICMSDRPCGARP